MDGRPSERDGVGRRYFRRVGIGRERSKGAPCGLAVIGNGWQAFPEGRELIKGLPKGPK